MPPREPTLEEGIFSFRQSQVPKDPLPQLPDDPKAQVRILAPLLAEAAMDPYGHLHYDVPAIKYRLDLAMERLAPQPPKDNVVIHPSYAQRTA